MCDLAYVVWRDQTESHAQTMLLAKTTMKAAGGKAEGGGEIELQTPMQVLNDFDDMLVKPLNYARGRAAALKVVSS